MSGPNTAFSGLPHRGTEVVIDHENGVDLATYALYPADGFMQRVPQERSDTGIERVRGMFATRNWSHDRKAYVWNIFRMNDDNAHTGEHVFTLQAGNGDSLGGPIDASGNRIIVSGSRVFTQRPPETLSSNIVRIYNLPTNHDPIAAQTFGFEMPEHACGMAARTRQRLHCHAREQQRCLAPGQHRGDTGRVAHDESTYHAEHPERDHVAGHLRRGSLGRSRDAPYR